MSARRNLPPAWDEQAASLSGAASEPLNPDPEAIGLVGHRAGAEGPTFGISGALVFLKKYILKNILTSPSTNVYRLCLDPRARVSFG